MRASVITFFFALISTLRCFAEDSTNEFLLLKHQSRHQAYEWRVSEARLLATPEWDFDRRKIPIDATEAWRIAKDWLKKHGHDDPELIRIEIRRLAIESTVGKTDKRWLKRFYYRIDCIPAVFDSMAVVVLMDGTVVEPKRISDLPVEEIK